MEKQSRVVVAFCAVVAWIGLCFLLFYAQPATRDKDDRESDAEISGRESPDRHVPVVHGGSLDIEITGGAEGVDRSEVSQNVADFLSQGTAVAFSEEAVRGLVSYEDLPSLYQALQDDRFAKKWRRVLLAICVLEEDDEAFAVAKQFLSTPWKWEDSPYEGREAARIIRSISKSIMNLAMLDRELVGPFLQECITTEGANAFLERWKGRSFPDKDYEAVFVRDFIQSAAYGLMHTQSPELFQAVVEEYYTLRAMDKPSTSEWERMTAFQQVLAEHAVYEDMGWEEGKNLLRELDSHQKLNLIMSYMGKVEAESQRRFGKEQASGSDGL